MSNIKKIHYVNAYDVSNNDDLYTACGILVRRNGNFNHKDIKIHTNSVYDYEYFKHNNDITCKNCKKADK